MMKTYAVEHELELKDALELAVCTVEKPPLRSAVFVFALWGLAAWTGLSGMDNSWYWLIFTSAVLATVLFAQRLSARRMIRNEMAQAYRDPTNRIRLTHYRVTITPEHISLGSPIAENVIRWEGVAGLLVNDEYLFIFFNDWDGHAIPRRAFPDDEAFREFVAAAKQFHSGHRQ